MRPGPSSSRPCSAPSGFLLLAGLLAASAVRADTTIAPETASAHAYSANTGWINARGDGANGAVIGEFTCSGFLYSANCGWIQLGSGVPANGIRYQNNSATDFGVNTVTYTSSGPLWEATLRGFAYGANIGWVNFESLGNPRVNLITGRLLGYAYSANVGWIALSETGVTVLTTRLQPGLDSDTDGIPDGWERTYTALLTTMTATTDTDRDGVSDLAEYAADTSPVDARDRFAITAFSAPRAIPAPTADFTWTSRPTRQYAIVSNPGLTAPWVMRADRIQPSGGAVTSFSLPATLQPPRTFFRVTSRLPLAP